jgi:hypothetical protein
MTHHPPAVDNGSHVATVRSPGEASAATSMVDQVPVLVSLPELATPASQRALDKESLRLQVGRLRKLNWRRLSASFTGNVTVVGILLVLTLATYWGLTSKDFRFVKPGGSLETIEARQEMPTPDTLRLTFQEELSMEPVLGEESRPDVDLSKVTEPEPTRLLGRHDPARVGQLIIQPVDPVLTARRKDLFEEEDGDAALQVLKPVPR